MRLPPILRKIHDKVTTKMSNSWIVENILIAKVTEDDGEEYDCIYCTIIRNAIIFGIFGFILGYFLCR